MSAVICRQVLAAGLFVWAVGVQAELSSTADRLYQLVDARLALMEAVASHKWQAGDPIEDPAREARVVHAGVADGLRQGFVPATSAALFEAQIAAAKSIQSYWFARWQSGERPRPADDLATIIRPELLRLGEQIMVAAAQPGITHSRELFDAQVRSEGLSERDRASLFEALASLRRFASRLEQVLETGELRVGTTGDYAPFSLKEATGVDYRGIDMDLAADLAAALGVRMRIVPTSWPTLSGDLQSGAFDIAMSGVSRTLDRAKVGYLSIAYFTDGKSPIVRCADVERFDSLEKIDQQGVRVIVNPGGTNQAYVDEHIRHADVRLHDDNRTIFDGIARGEADVMITDRIEVELRSHLNPELCPALTGTLTHQEKGYFLPKDIELKTFVDTWLQMRLQDGTVAAAFDRHMP
ncbi:MAG: transporter substrate-binding domain-containing protein [Pseudomonadales bacterium]|nr:transporter substrate-binding domain-containing protein [Pseudomonadales bacterium]